MPPTVNRTGVSSVSVPLVLVVCFLSAVAVGFYALVFLRALLVNDKAADLTSAATKGAHTLDRLLFERYEDIKVFATDRTLTDGTDQEKINRLRQYKDLYGYYSWIGTTDGTGAIIAATQALTDTSGSNSAIGSRSLDLLKAVRATRLVQSEVIGGSNEQADAPAVVFAAPFDDRRGAFRGVVISAMPLEHFRAVLEEEGAQQEGDAIDWILVDRDGRTLLRKHQSLSSLAAVQPGSLRGIAEGPERSGFIEESRARDGNAFVTGFARTAGYRDFPGFGWSLLVQVDRAHAYAPINKLVWMVGLTWLLIIAPLTAFGIFAARKLVREREDLRRAQQELERSIAELARSNSDLQQFAYVASHDLQEPLRMVASYTQLLGKRYKGKLDEDADEFIGYAVNGANRMQALIQDLLAFSRVDRQGRQFERTSVETLLSYALDNLKGAIEESGAVVTHDPLPDVLADERQVLHVLQNLLSNSIKFRGPEPPLVHLSAIRRGDEWLFSVRDNGIGIDPQYGDRIFVIFQRLHTNAEYPGTGIGLSLCKKIVERHGGRIWMESQLGHGATFNFTLPATALPS
jgi:signal transduction histidine kinase